MANFGHSYGGMLGDGAMSLEALGLAPIEERVYRLLIRQPESTLAELTGAAQVSAQVIRRSMERLETLGFATRTAGRPAKYAASPPDLAVEALVARRHEELEHARREARRLTEFYRSVCSRSARSSPVEIVSGPQATRQRWMQIQHTAKELVRLIDKPPYIVPTDAPNPEELRLLTKGIRYHVIYDAESFSVPGKLDSAHTCVAAGETARVLHDTPIKLIVVDRQLAFTHELGVGSIRDAVIVHKSSLLDALITMFDALWERATPLAFGDGAEIEGCGGPLDETDEQILTLMSAGLKDDAIARQLGVSVRTVRRRSTAIMDCLGARSRFHAGFIAALRA